MANSFRDQFVKKAKTHSSDVKKYKHKEGNSYGPVDVSDGSYQAVVTAETSVPIKGSMEGVPIVKFKATINSGKYEGMEPSQSYFCEGKAPEDDRPTAEQQVIALCQYLLPDIDIQEVEQVPDALDLINERGPICVIGIKNTKSEKTGKEYQNVYFNKLVKPISFEQDTDTEGEAQEKGSTDDPDYVPMVKDVVRLTDEGDDEWEVSSVSQSRQTANLKNPEGTRKNGIAWNDLALV